MELLNTILGGVVGGLVTVAGVFIAWKLNAKHAMRTAVIERRFHAHQEAHTHLYRMELHTYFGGSDDLPGITREAYDWWLENSLYLDEEPRIAFKNATSAAHNFFNIPSSSKADPDGFNYKIINNAVKALEKAASLPPLSGKPSKEESMIIGHDDS